MAVRQAKASVVLTNRVEVDLDIVRESFSWTFHILGEMNNAVVNGNKFVIRGTGGPNFNPQASRDLAALLINKCAPLKRSQHRTQAAQ